MSDYDVTPAIRAIDYFVQEQLSNWYVRLSRRVFWKGEMSREKEAAYQTLYECLQTVATLMSPIAPFYAEKLWQDLRASQDELAESVHLSFFPAVNESEIDTHLEERVDMARRLTSLILSIRKKERVKVRQPLQKAMVAVLGKDMHEALDLVADQIEAEVNIKELEYITGENSVPVKKVKPNFRALGPKIGKLVKEVGPALGKLSQDDIRDFEANGSITLALSTQEFELTLEDAEIVTEDIPGWSVASDGRYTVALDLTITEELKQEGIARELVKRIQDARKGQGFELTDRIRVQVSQHDELQAAIEKHAAYVQQETLADELSVVAGLAGGEEVDIEGTAAGSCTHLRGHETVPRPVCRLLPQKKNKKSASVQCS